MAAKTSTVAAAASVSSSSSSSGRLPGIPEGPIAAPSSGLNECGIGFSLEGGGAPRLSPFISSSAVKVTMDNNQGYDQEVVETNEEMRNYLKVSAEASVGYGMFKSSAKAELARDSVISGNSFSLVGQCDVKLGSWKIKEPKLTDDAKALLAQPNGDKLFEQCYGQFYVSELVRGASIQVSLNISCTSSTSKQDVKAKIEVSGGFGAFSGSGSGSVDSSTSSVLKNTSRDFNWRITGMTLASSVTLTESNVQDFLNKFPQWVQEDIKSDGVPLYVSFAPYSSLPEYVLLNTAKGRTVASMASYYESDEMKALANYYSEYSALTQTINSLVGASASTHLSGDVVAKLEKLANDLLSLQTKISNAICDPVAGHVLVSQLRSYAYYDAQLQNIISTWSAPATRTGMYGAGFGKWFDDGDVGGDRAISSLLVRHGHAIDAIQIKYRDGGSGGLLGGSGGGASEFKLDDGEHIVAIMISWGGDSWLRSIQFLSDKGRTSDVYGQLQGNRTTISAPSGSVLRSFSGIWGHDKPYVNWISCYWGKPVVTTSTSS